MTQELAYLLATRGVVTREDLAELATDDLLELYEDINAEDAAALIMKARAHWFEEEQQA